MVRPITDKFYVCRISLKGGVLRRWKVRFSMSIP